MKNQMLSVIHFRSSNQFSGRLTRRLSLYIAGAVACATLLPITRAVSPPPDGGYPNGNTAEGDFALNDLTSGQNNTAVGPSALFNNTSGSNNTAVGPDALLNNNADDNTATGFEALFSNTTGNNNIATGGDALRNNTTGDNNTATGFKALFSNTNGISNTAAGLQALFSNTTGFANTATGVVALGSNTTGGENTATGVGALIGNTTGGNNVGDGFETLFNNTTGRNNIALGSNAGFNLTTGSNNIEIGNAGLKAEANTIRLGTKGTQKKTFIAGISGVAVTGSQVVVNANGQLGVAGSSARFKQAIKPMDKTSEAILRLEPVTFRYKEEIDPDGAPQFGLIAEQVEKVSPDLVARDEQGKPYTVRYEAVNAMLLNEFLKEHKKAEQEARINRDQEREIATLRAALKEQAAQIQKVSHQLVLSRPVPRIVSNNP